MKTARMDDPATFPLAWEAIVRDAPSLYLLLAPDLTIVGATNAYLQATMTRREEIVGRQLFDVFPDNPDDREPSGERNLRASLQHVIDQRAPHFMALQKYDIRRPDEDGGGFEVRYWSPSNWPVLDSEGALHCVIHRVEDVTELVELRDAGTQMELELIARTERLREVTGPAREAADEYHRALRDYTQLMRHRLANPLSAITGGVATLRDLDMRLDRATRMQILDAMRDVASQLERAIVDPESIDEVERGELNAIPDMRGRDIEDCVGLDGARVGRMFREINHHMVAQLRDQSPSRRVMFLCECCSLDCTDTVSMPLREYFAIHERRHRFMVCAGHELLSVGHVVDRRKGWLVVRNA